MKCLHDDGECGLGGYCKECPWRRIAVLEDRNAELVLQWQQKARLALECRESAKSTIMDRDIDIGLLRGECDRLRWELDECNGVIR